MKTARDEHTRHERTDSSRRFNDLFHCVRDAEDHQDGCRKSEKPVIQERINQDTRHIEIPHITSYVGRIVFMPVVLQRRSDIAENIGGSPDSVS